MRPQHANENEDRYNTDYGRKLSVFCQYDHVGKFSREAQSSTPFCSMNARGGITMVEASGIRC